MATSKDLVAAGSAISQIDPDQTLKASKALLAHIKKAARQKAESSSKKDVLEDSEAGEPETIWLTLTTKRHIVDKTRLQPGRISLPHSLHSRDEAASPSICLIVADPQRAYKDIVASEAFPEDLRKRVTRVIDVTKLKAKFGQYEAQRKLYAEHDVFLGDDRIINRLPKLLGKTFYKTTLKRPVPVVLTPKPKKVAGKRVRSKRVEGQVHAGTPGDIAGEIRKALGSALVSLTPSTSTAVRVARSDFTAEQVAENVAAVAGRLVEKWVPQKWRNVKSIYLKGTETAALPIWLTDELWLDEKDVIADGPVEEEKANKKRKAVEGADGSEEPVPKKKTTTTTTTTKTKTKTKTGTEAKPESNDGALDQQISDRKARLRKQKAKAAE